MRTEYDFKSFLATARVLKILNPSLFELMNTNQIVSEMIELTNQYDPLEFDMFGTAGYMITRLKFSDHQEFVATLDCECLGDRIVSNQSDSNKLKEVFDLNREVNKTSYIDFKNKQKAIEYTIELVKLNDQPNTEVNELKFFIEEYIHVN